MSPFADQSFGALDYAVFSSLLIASGAIGVYYAIRAKKNQVSTAEYIFGGKTMKTLPVAISLIATFLSGSSLVSIPAEVYFYGLEIAVTYITSVVIGYLTLRFISLPVIKDLQLPSLFAYLEKRFDRRILVIANIQSTLTTLLGISATIYAPALAFSQITGFSLYYIAAVACLICMFYTSFGGVRAVVWADTLQFLVIGGALFLMIFLGLQAKDVTQVWAAGVRGERINIQ